MLFLNFLKRFSIRALGRSKLYRPTVVNIKRIISAESLFKDVDLFMNFYAVNKLLDISMMYHFDT